MPISMRQIEAALNPLTLDVPASAANSTVDNVDILSGEFATDRFEASVNRPASVPVPALDTSILEGLDVEDLVGRDFRLRATHDGRELVDGS